MTMGMNLARINGDKIEIIMYGASAGVKVLCEYILCDMHQSVFALETTRALKIYDFADGSFMDPNIMFESNEFDEMISFDFDATQFNPTTFDKFINSSKYHVDFFVGPVPGEIKK